MNQAQHDNARKLRVLNHAKQSGNISLTCRYFGISRETFYQWKRSSAEKGEPALINRKPCPENPKLRTKKAAEEKILHLRRTERVYGVSSLSAKQADAKRLLEIVRKPWMIENGLHYRRV